MPVPWILWDLGQVESKLGQTIGILGVLLSSCICQCTAISLLAGVFVRHLFVDLLD